MGRWEKLVMFALMNMSDMALMLGVLVELVDNVGNREHCGFLEAPMESHSPLGGALIEAVTKVLCIQWWWEHPKVLTDQHMPEEVFK